MTDNNKLNSQFAIPKVVMIGPGEGGLPRISVTAEQGDAHVYLHGAYVTHFLPRGSSDLLFMSRKSHFEPGKAIRGGVPVIFPWFGPKADDPKAPMHGFARTNEWKLTGTQRLADGTISLALEFASSP